ncbi:MAG: hypothetical protein IKY26_05920 [Erysipelotrichaceae bacterium]|nr:hypothetical protein [Erysipelotrichaceae bacterium]
MDKVLETVIEGIEFTFEKDILVKPLEPVMITKEYEEQIPTGEQDEEGFNKYEVKKHTKEVESDFAKGIVLALPQNIEPYFNVGDIVIFPRKFAKDFDLFKNSQLVKPYDIVAKVK